MKPIRTNIKSKTKKGNINNNNNNNKAFVSNKLG
uniref:Uncharacterized protein n=1 Tax=Arundo donax TaxID=35708 RepID=A0A0A9ELC8_ARUDO